MNNPPAFPHTVEYRGSDCGGIVPYGGMTLRDYLAAKAMQAIMGDSRYAGFIGVNNYQHRTAEDAYKMADAMLAAREQK